jgi:hypothetical protein
MSSSKWRRKARKGTMTLREECLAENKEIGLEQAQERFDLIFKVLHEHGINSQLWLQEYLEACAAHGGQTPPDFERFLPWNLSSAQKARLSQESTFQMGDANFVRTGNGSVFHLEENGRRTKIDIGSLTGEQFEKLTGLR